MKKTFTLLTAVLLSVSLFAYPALTKLTVSASGKKAVTIVVDGKTYTDKQNNDEVVINNLAAGSHNIKVYQQNSNGWFNKKSELLYDGNVYVRANSNTKVMINKAGKAVITERAMRGRDRDDEMNYPSNGENGGWNYRYPQAMNDRGLDQLRYTINKTSFENSKLGVAKEAISQNYFTASQVQLLMGSFNYESSKLEIAKFAYDRTLDKENYYTVGNALTFNSSKDELTRFLQRAR